MALCLGHCGGVLSVYSDVKREVLLYSLNFNSSEVEIYELCRKIEHLMAYY